MIEIKLLIFCLFIINITVANLNIDENGNYKVDNMIMSPNQYLKLDKKAVKKI